MNRLATDTRATKLGAQIPVAGQNTGAGRAAQGAQWAMQQVMDGGVKARVQELLSHNIASDTLYEALCNGVVAPLEFLGVMFNDYFRLGKRIPEAARILILEDPRLRPEVFAHAERLIDSSRLNSHQDQHALLEWMYYILGQSSGVWIRADIENLREALEKDDESAISEAIQPITSTISYAFDQLKSAVHGQNNFRNLDEAYQEFVIMSEMFNRLLIGLSQYPKYYRIVAALREELHNTYRDAEKLLENKDEILHEDKIRVLVNFRGRLLINTSHCIDWDDAVRTMEADARDVLGEGVTEEELGDYLKSATKKALHDMQKGLEDGYTMQELTKFRGKPDHKRRAHQAKLGNNAIGGLRFFQAYGDRFLAPAVVDSIKEKNIQTIRSLYGGKNTAYVKSADVLREFMREDHGSGDEHDIETVRNLVQWDSAIPLDALEDLATYLVLHGAYADPVFEWFRIQIFSWTIERLAQIEDRTVGEKVVSNLEEKIPMNIARTSSVDDYAFLYYHIAYYRAQQAHRALRVGEDFTEMQRKMYDAFVMFRTLTNPARLGVDMNPLSRLVGLIESGITNKDELWGEVLSGVGKIGGKRLTDFFHLHNAELKSYLLSAYNDVRTGYDTSNAIDLATVTDRFQKQLSSLSGDIQERICKRHICSVIITSPSVKGNDPSDGLLPGKEISTIEANGMKIHFIHDTSFRASVRDIIEEYGDAIRLVANQLSSRYQTIQTLVKSQDQYYKNELTDLPNERQLKSDLKWVPTNVTNVAFLRIRNYGSRFNDSMDCAKSLSHEVAIALWSCVGMMGKLYHTSFSTFAIVGSPEVSAEAFRDFIEKIPQLLKSTLSSRASFEIGGLSRWEWQTDRWADNLAKIALAKSSKTPNRAHWFKEEDEHELRRHLVVHEALMAALDNTGGRSIKAYYQTIFDPKNPDNVRLEALARIEIRDDVDPDNVRVLTPNTFLPIAETEEVLPELTERVIEQVQQDILAHPNRKMSISINIDAQDWNSTKILSALEKMAGDTRFKGRLPILELKETNELAQDTESLKDDVAKINYLRGLGYEFAIDDLGTASSNFINLSVLRPKYIKLDSKFVTLLENEDTREGAEETVRGIVAIAKKKKSKVIIIAEHVKDERIFEIFRKLWVHWFQGYLFGEPAPLDTALGRIENSRQWSLL